MAKMSAQDWIDEIDRAIAYRQIYGREAAWRKNEQNFTNDPSSHAAMGPNLVFEMGDTLLSEGGRFDPEIVANPTHPAGVDRAPIVESIDNYLIRKMKMKRHIKRASQHSYLYHRAILKIGYDSEFGWNPDLDIGSMQVPLGLSISQFNKKGMRIEDKDLNPGMPWISSVIPHDFAVPWGTIELDDSPWAAHRVIRLNSDIREDPKYKNTSGLKASMSIEDFINSYLNVGLLKSRITDTRRRNLSSQRPRLMYNELWEIHDRRDGRVKVVCKDHKGFLRDEPDAIMACCGMPFVSGTFTEHPRSFWGTPLAYYLGQLQAEQYDISKQSEKQRRISILRFLVAKDFITQEDLQKVMSGDVGAFAFTKAVSNLRDKIMPVPTGNLLDFVLQSNQVRQDARAMIGFSRNQAGEFDVGTRRTKGEAMLVAQGSMIRQSPRLQMIADLYLDVMEKVNQVIFTYWTVPRSVMIGKEWVRFTGDEIKGEYLYDLNLTQKRVLSKAERRVEALMMLAHLGPLLEGQDPSQILEHLVNAANDPAFERLLGYTRGGGGGGRGRGESEMVRGGQNASV